jgi:hypothetical protein
MKYEQIEQIPCAKLTTSIEGYSLRQKIQFRIDVRLNQQSHAR